jgi:hypothetical protein
MQILIILCIVLLPFNLRAEDKQSIQVNGFFLGNYTGRITDEHPGDKEGGDFLLEEERIRLEFLTRAEPSSSLIINGDILHDSMTKESSINIREAYLNHSSGNINYRLGRQIITWGVGDLIFINDIFPKDFNSFFSGRPMDYLKIGVDALKMHLSSDIASGEIVVMPFFEPDNLPSEKRFIYPFQSDLKKKINKPTPSYNNMELAVRLYKYFMETDISVYSYRGFYHQPAFHSDSTEITGFFPHLSVYGLSGQRNLLNGVGSLELGYYDSQDDRKGDDPAIPNSKYKILMGYQQEVLTDFTLGLQYYREEIVQDSDSAEQNRDLVTLRLTRFLNYQIWRLSLFAFYSLSDKDYLAIPEILYKISDQFSITTGANIFGGERETTFFGYLDKNDNIYINIRFDF